jgi:hypothetical protein
MKRRAVIVPVPGTTEQQHRDDDNSDSETEQDSERETTTTTMALSMASNLTHNVRAASSRRFSLCSAASSLIVLSLVVITIIDSLDAYVEQRREFDWHVDALKRVGNSTNPFLARARVEAEYMTERSQVGMMIMRVIEKNIFYRFAALLSRYAHENANSLSYGISLVTGNFWAMTGIIMLVLWLLAHIAIKSLHLLGVYAGSATIAKGVANELALQAALTASSQQRHLQCR